MSRGNADRVSKKTVARRAAGAVAGCVLAAVACVSAGCFGGSSPLPPEEALKQASESVERVLAQAAEDNKYSRDSKNSEDSPYNAPTVGNASAIELWYPEHPILGPALASDGEVLAAFGKEHPEIRLQAQPIGPWVYAVQKLTVAIASGDMPDMAVVKRDMLAALVDGKRVARLDTLLPQTLLDDLRPEVLRDHRIGDALYALPADGFCSVLFFHASDVAAPPETWDALLAYAKTFDGTPQKGMDRRFALGDLPFLESLWSAGGDVIRDGHSALAEPAAVETINFLWSLRNGRVALPGTFGRRDASMSWFYEGRIAMTVGNSAGLAMKTPDVDVAPVPGKNGPVSMRSNDVIVAFAGRAEAKRDAIASVLDLLTGMSVQGQRAVDMGSVPARKSVAANVKVPEGLERAFAVSRATPLLRVWPEVESEVERYVLRGLWWKGE
ncbi:MAG: extracellular solute-binding protein [Candidatus Hydrogenedentes bacterium]|nr:extracellular solute-binding protein [Candidatus Hydrogenedentota bacterium]